MNKRRGLQIVIDRSRNTKLKPFRLFLNGLFGFHLFEGGAL